MTSDLRDGWKVLTHDCRPPVRGGAPIWDGLTLPCTLAAVGLDTSQAECGTGGGWHYSAELSTALALAGFWPDGWPSRAVRVHAAADALQRGDKRRASSLSLLREATQEEMETAVRALSERWFGADAGRMATEQLAWREALARPRRDRDAVEACLRQALATRGLHWHLQEFPAARAAREAWEAGAAWAAWDAGAARAAREAWEAGEAWQARESLTQTYASLRGWIRTPPDFLAAGLREAYAHGLAIALPTGPGELGYALAT